jgi:hypothetical protein
MASRSCSFVLLACGSLLVWAGEPVCEPSDCFDGSCGGKEVAIERFGLSLDKWDRSIKNYTNVGMIDSHALKEKEFGWFLHGPLYLEKDIASGEFPPPSSILNNHAKEDLQA